MLLAPIFDHLALAVVFGGLALALAELAFRDPEMLVRQVHEARRLAAQGD